jgi:hypothetical protein
MFVVICALLLSSANTFAQKADFSGSFTYNAGKSQAGESRRAPASKIVATQDAAALIVERTAKDRDGNDVVTKAKYTLDGKESENSAPGFGGQNMVTKSTAVWSTDGKSLVINSTATFDRNGEKMEMKSSETFSLNADGGLTIVAVRTGQNGEMKQTLVYDKGK